MELLHFTLTEAVIYFLLFLVMDLVLRDKDDDETIAFFVVTAVVNNALIVAGFDRFLHDAGDVWGWLQFALAIVVFAFARGFFGAALRDLKRLWRNHA